MGGVEVELVVDEVDGVVGVADVVCVEAELVLGVVDCAEVEVDVLAGIVVNGPPGPSKGHHEPMQFSQFVCASAHQPRC